MSDTRSEGARPAALRSGVDVPAGRPEGLRELLVGARSAGKATTTKPDPLLEGARQAYALGQFAQVVEMLKMPVQGLESAVEQQGPGEEIGAVPARRNAACAWALLARAAARTGQHDLGEEAAERASAHFAALRANGQTLSKDEREHEAISFYLAGRLEDAARAMHELAGEGAASPEIDVYRGVLESRAGNLEGAVGALEVAAADQAQDLQQLRLETLASALVALGPDHAERAVDVYGSLAGLHFNASRYQAALETLDLARALRPGDARVVAGRAEVLSKLGRPDEALSAFDEALSIQPDFALALVRRGQLLTELKRFEEAIRSFDAALSIGPDDVDALTGKGVVLRLLGRYEDSLAELDRALAHAPGYVWALTSKGETLRVLGRLDEAISTFDAALAIAPGDATVLASKGECLRMQGRYEESLAELDKALAHAPGYVWALTSKGDALRLMGRLDEAISAFDAALAIVPDDAWALAHKGDALRLVGRYDDALVALGRAVELDPMDKFALARRGETLRMLGRFEESLVDFEKALEKAPGDVLTLRGKADALQLMGRLDEAISAFDAALAIVPDDAWALAHKGDALRLVGRYDDALVALGRAVELDATDEFALATRGETLRRLGRHSEAEQLLVRSLVLEPKDLFALNALAANFVDQGRDREALDVAHRALRNHPEDPEALKVKSLALMHLDDVDGALKVIERRIEVGPVSGYAHGMRGALLGMIESYEQSRQELERSVELEPNTAWAQSALAECCLRLASGKPPSEARPLVAKAELASRRAVELEPDDPTWHQTLADVLWRLGPERRRESIEEYGRLLNRARSQDKRDFYNALSAGWAAFRQSSDESLGAASLLAEAEGYFLEALATKRDRPSSADAIEAKFGLALAVICTARFGLGLREYDGAMELASKKQPGLHRGLVGRAMADLLEAMADRPQMQGVRHVEKALRALERMHAKALERLAADVAIDEEPAADNGLVLDRSAEEVYAPPVASGQA